MRRALALIALILLATSCSRRYNASDYTLGPTLVATILDLTVDPPNAPADGISVITVTATINADSTKRNVQFTATDGTFTVGAQTDVKKAVVAADSAGHAVTQLRTSTTVGTVKVDAVLDFDTNTSYRQTRDVQFQVPNADNVLTLTSSAPTVAADGFSRVTITATMKLSGGTSTQRQINFKSSEGLLYAFGKTPDKDITVSVSADGVANVELESTKNVRQAHVTATVADVTREVVVNQVTVDPTSIITLTTSSPTAPADGVTLTRVFAKISPALPSTKRNVTFSVTPNTVTISPQQQVADSGNQVSADVTSLKVTGSVRVTATVDQTSAQATIQLVPALPDRILMTSASPTVAATATDSVLITATLQRDVGDVSVGTNVTFTATDASGTTVGSFAKNSVSDANGVATATFFPGVATTPGPVTITARVNNAAAVGTLRITVMP